MKSLSSCAGDGENPNECGEQKEPKHSEQRDEKSSIGRIWLYFCKWMATLPAKTSPQRPGKLTWDSPGHLHTPSCLAWPIASNICGALGGFVRVVWYYNSVIVVQYSSLLTSAEVFQAWWWTPAHYREEIQAAVVPGIRSRGEMWEDERRPWGLFLWWLNTKAFNSFSSSWVIGILN